MPCTSLMSTLRSFAEVLHSLCCNKLIVLTLVGQYHWCFCQPCLYQFKGRKGRLLLGLRGDVLLGQNLDQMEAESEVESIESTYESCT